jgi:hypothetical protein
MGRFILPFAVDAPASSGGSKQCDLDLHPSI